MHGWSTLKKLIWLYKAKGGGGTPSEETTITGVSPLVLAMAVRGKLSSLTQYGKTAQATTPTPSAPVDIYCNNGKLTMVDDELPAGYKRVLGFRCDNNAMWEIPDFHLRGSDTVRISFSINAACNVWGCYQGTSATDNYDLYASVSAGSKYLRYSDGTYLSYWSNSDLGERFDTVVTPTGTSGMPQDSTWTPKTFESANSMLIGSTTVSGTSSKLKGNLYGNVVVDGRLKLIPCERVSDNVLGYYDTYSETFYPPYEGFAGAVSLGYDGSHYTLQTVGTAEVITLGEHTASAVDLFSVDTYADTQEVISGAVTRKVGITVLTGEETGWALSDSGTTHRFRGSKPADCFTPSGRAPIVSSHFTYIGTGQATGGAFVGASQYWYWIPTDQTIDTADKWRDWLKAQYAQGTPVIALYPLATATTESADPQELYTQKGVENTIVVTAEVSDITFDAVYLKNALYTALTSLSFSGDAYYPTGVIPKTWDYEVEADAAFSGATTSPVVLWGFMGTPANLPRWQIAGYTSKWLMSVNATTASGTYDTDRHTFKVKVYDDAGTKKFDGYVDGTTIFNNPQTVQNTALYEANEWEAYIGARNNNNTAGNYFSGTLYTLKVYKGGVLIHHYIPVTRTADSVVGLYDYNADAFIEKGE